MTANVGTFPVKILAQVADDAPFEIGVYEVPVQVGGLKKADDGAYYLDLKVSSLTED